METILMEMNEATILVAILVLVMYKIKSAFIFYIIYRVYQIIILIKRKIFTVFQLIYIFKN